MARFATNHAGSMSAAPDVERVTHMDIAKLANQHIAGQWRSGTGEKVLIDRNPFNGEVLGEFAVATAADIDEAYRASAEAQVAWAETNAYAKRTVFENAARIVGSASARSPSSSSPRSAAPPSRRASRSGWSSTR